MSDLYEYWFFPELEKNEVAAAKKRVLNVFWREGWLEKKNDPESVLGGGEAYAPTETLASLYSLPDKLGGVPLSLCTRGVEVCEDFGFQGHELNEIEAVSCPKCAYSHKLEASPIIPAINDFHESETIPHVTCSSCQTNTDVRSWITSPRLTFTYLGFSFWNWPSLIDRPADGLRPSGIWKINIPKLMETAAKSPITWSNGRI